jgi:hypothetical protein
MLRDESQAYARIRRFSQLYPTYTWRLVNEDSIIEDSIIKRQTARKTLAAMVFSFQTATDPPDFGQAEPANFVDWADDDPVSTPAKPAPRGYAREHISGDNPEDQYELFSDEEFEV